MKRMTLIRYNQGNSFLVGRTKQGESWMDQSPWCTRNEPCVDSSKGLSYRPRRSRDLRATGKVPYFGKSCLVVGWTRRYDFYFWRCGYQWQQSVCYHVYTLQIAWAIPWKSNRGDWSSWRVTKSNYLELVGRSLSTLAFTESTWHAAILPVSIGPQQEW